METARVTTERNFAIDCIRVIAILCVVLNHAVETSYQFSFECMRQASVYSRVFAYAMFSAGRLGVPLFLMITGFLFLDREFDYKVCMKFYKRNVLGLFVTMMIWCVIYSFIGFFSNKSFSLAELVKNIFLVKSVGLVHMWYMPMILGIYLFIPLLANTLKNTVLKILVIPMTISFIYIFILPIINVALRDFQLLNLPIFFNEYLFLLIIGYLIKKKCFGKISLKSLHLLFLCSYSLTIALQLYAIQIGKIYNAWYNCGLLLVASASLFLLLYRWITDRAQAVCSAIHAMITRLADYSFGVYFLHLFFIKMFSKDIQVTRSLKTLLVFLLSVICSYALAFAIGRIKILRKTMFYIK